MVDLDNRLPHQLQTTIRERRKIMNRMIFVNLPITDLDRSIAFYTAVGFVKDDRFCDGSAAMMALSPEIAVMLLTHERFNTFTPKRIADAHQTAQALLCISEISRDGVNGLVDRAITAGAKPDPTPTQDFGFMFGRSFEDPDGHIWEVMWMDVEAAMAAQPEPAAA
jgi:predicted lactoylglutathione lyase